jgi:hypothetical protein
MAGDAVCDEESGRDGRGGIETSRQYGANEQRGLGKPTSSRAWALGIIVLACALVGGAQLTRPGVVSELMAKGHAAVAGPTSPSAIAPLDTYSAKKMSYVKGETHMMNDVFNKENTESELKDHLFELIHPSLLKELEGEIAREMEEEVQQAVKKEQQEYYLDTTKSIQTEMNGVMEDVNSQKQINSRFMSIVKRAKQLQGEECHGEKCENWDALLAAAQKKVDALRKELATEKKARRADRAMEHAKEQKYSAITDSASSKSEKLEDEIKYWHGLANVYYAMLHPRTPPPAPPPPPPPHCSGLKTIYGAVGSISTGPASSVVNPDFNDCRWVIKSPVAGIVLRFPGVKLPGSEARVSVFVGPENVALYKDEDVINWAAAYKSFTGLTYPAPIVCHSNEVSFCFQTNPRPAQMSFRLCTHDRKH